MPALPGKRASCDRLRYFTYVFRLEHRLPVRTHQSVPGLLDRIVRARRERGVQLTEDDCELDADVTVEKRPRDLCGHPPLDCFVHGFADDLQECGGGGLRECRLEDDELLERDAERSVDRREHVSSQALAGSIGCLVACGEATDDILGDDAARE